MQKEIIAQLPIFMGLSEKEIAEIASNVPFAQHHHKKGATIIDAESVCNELIIVTSGTMDCETESDDNSYRLVENLHAIHTLEPDKLYGLEQRYRSAYRATSPCESIAIAKEKFHELIDKYLIVRLNYMNMICRKAQKLEHNPWKACSSDMKQRIAKFVKDRSQHPAGSKKLFITMVRLANEMGCSRLEISAALNELADLERIILKRGIIEIPALQLL
jgi:CRP-like cAMP-binding protein